MAKKARDIYMQLFAVQSDSASTDELVEIPATKFPVKTFINVATTLWNSNQHLRSAASIGVAKRVASSLAEACPL